eukprot:NODE_1023_length_1050_cov_87.990249_g979_i0.p1 GENE.NODE_1023_length_1050_cov_87.990249_g979_i0~~NODE_1023_length_1050_cov_87.990249_g979_i0.p1  ORF type:complete len:289 (-),score=7.26 NODE_1023_length_1050_cov_87.990249_g979_i0:49-915(-)
MPPKSRTVAGSRGTHRNPSPTKNRLPPVSTTPRGAVTSSRLEGDDTMAYEDDLRDASSANKAFRSRMGVKPNFTGPVFAPETSSLVCKVCSQRVDAISRIYVGKGVYHPRCLQCDYCKGKHEDMYIEFQDRPMCNNCAMANPQARAQIKRQAHKHSDAQLKCSGCHGPLEGKIATAIGGHYHPDCFKCAECGKPFEKVGRYVEKNGQPYHVDCVAETAVTQVVRSPVSGCRGCGKAIDGAFVTLPGLGNFHKHCVRCTKCRKAITGTKFYEDPASGLPLCVRCGTLKS